MDGFEMDNSYNPMHLHDLSRWLQHATYEKGSPYRIWAILMVISGCRPSEPEDANWSHFNGDVWYLRPRKQHRKVTRPIKIPPGAYMELMQFKNDNFFRKGQLFNFQYKTMQRDFNARVRGLLGGGFMDYDSRVHSGAVSTKHHYTLRSVRVTISCLIYHCFCREYAPEIALSRTCRWMGHRSTHMTADHYIKNLHKIGLEGLPNLPALQLLDYILYHNDQLTLIQPYPNPSQISLRAF